MKKMYPLSLPLKNENEEENNFILTEEEINALKVCAKLRGLSLVKHVSNILKKSVKG